MCFTRSSVEKHINEYYVFEIDNNIVGVVAVQPWPAEKKVELACLQVNPAHEHRGIGTRLAVRAESLAREMGAESVFCLSTQAFTFFQHKLGYREGTTDDLPPARREKYGQSGRNSKILVKSVVTPSPASVPSPREPALSSPPA
jgi:amino-acid N-acetyltransferase